MVCSWGILFWRKSDDWMALLVALMLICLGANKGRTLAVAFPSDISYLAHAQLHRVERGALFG